GRLPATIDWNATHVWWTPGAVRPMQNGFRWRFDVNDATARAGAAVAMADVVLGPAGVLFDRFGDDRAILEELLDDEYGASEQTDAIRWTIGLGRVYGNTEWEPRLQQLLRARRDEHRHAMRDGHSAAAALFGHSGVLVTNILGDPITSDRIDEVVDREL